jgi:hypothetical protein
MYSMRIGRALCGVSLALLCVSCGGGGGSSGSPSSSTPPPSQGTPPPSQGTPPPDQTPGPQPTFSISGSTFAFESVHPNVTPDSQRIPVAISGSVNGTLYILSSSDDSRVASASIDYSSSSGQQPTVNAFVVPGRASALIGAYSTTITLTACVNDPTCATGQLPGSPQKINVTYTLRSEIQGDVVGPRVVTAGEPGTVILHGRGLSGATQVSFGGVAASDVKVSSLNGDAEVRAKYPALAAGTYAVTINAGAIPFSASVVAVARPNFAPTKLLYPSTPQEIGGIAYDAERRALYVAARYPDSQANTLFRFQYDGSTWQAPESVKVPNLQDVALSSDGQTVLLATDIAVVELDVATLTSRGTYFPLYDLIRAGTAYIEGIAVANDGYAIITTGGANPSNVLLYSTTTHTFLTINSAANNGIGDVDSQLYFANAGVSINGSLVVLSQDPRTAALLPGRFTKPFIYLYSASESQRPILFASPTSQFSDKDRSQSGRSAKPAVYHADGVVAGTKIVVHGATPVVVSADYSARGSLPTSTRSAVFNVDGTRLFTFDAPAGTENGELRSYDVTTRLNPSTQMYPPVGTAVPLSPGSGTGVIAMTLTPDGGNVFIVGTAGVFVQPSPL